LQKRNNLTESTALIVGELLRIPAVLEGVSLIKEHATQRQYKVKEGDTLYAISVNHGLQVEDLQRENGLATADQISIGQRLVLPDLFAPTPAVTRLPEVVAPKHAKVQGPIHAATRCPLNFKVTRGRLLSKLVKDYLRACNFALDAWVTSRNDLIVDWQFSESATIATPDGFASLVSLLAHYSISLVPDLQVPNRYKAKSFATTTISIQSN
jgi:LysM repeat protein